MRLPAFVAMAVALAGCPSSRPPKRTTPIVGTRPVQPGQPKVAWQKIETAKDLPPAPGPGQFQIHMIDVGTGLAILVRGADFNMLFDAGTNDPQEKPKRVAAYLAATLGASGDDLCGEASDQRKKIDHIVLSHPHLDHASALDLVVHCYDVGDFWDSGAVNSTVFYRELLSGISRAAGLKYHTAIDVPENHVVEVKGLSVTIPNWDRFSEGDSVRLGEGAKFTVLHAEGKKHEDFNQNSIVLAVELGGIRVLLVGDAESGPRKDPSEPPGDVEEFLIESHKAEIRSDILQVGHHGSKTSSRRAFLEAVKPGLALVSSGPKQYGKTILPDREVIQALESVGAKVLRTDERDANCPVAERIGGDSGPGGCDGWVITIDPPASAK